MFLLRLNAVLYSFSKEYRWQWRQSWGDVLRNTTKRRLKKNQFYTHFVNDNDTEPSIQILSASLCTLIKVMTSHIKRIIFTNWMKVCRRSAWIWWIFAMMTPCLCFRELLIILTFVSFSTAMYIHKYFNKGFYLNDSDNCQSRFEMPLTALLVREWASVRVFSVVVSASIAYAVWLSKFKDLFSFVSWCCTLGYLFLFVSSSWLELVLIELAVYIRRMSSNWIRWLVEMKHWPRQDDKRLQWIL